MGGGYEEEEARKGHGWHGHCGWSLVLNMSREKQRQTATELGETNSALPLLSMHSALIRPVVAGTRRAALASRSYASQRPPTYEERPSYDTTDPEPNYPQLPYVSRQHLPPKQWDDMLLRRNYGDTVRQGSLRAMLT